MEWETEARPRLEVEARACAVLDSGFAVALLICSAALRVGKNRASSLVLPTLSKRATTNGCVPKVGAASKRASTDGIPPGDGVVGVASDGEPAVLWNVDGVLLRRIEAEDDLAPREARRGVLLPAPPYTTPVLSRKELRGVLLLFASNAALVRSFEVWRMRRSLRLPVWSLVQGEEDAG